MAKLQVGDRIKQVWSGYGTGYEDNHKEAIVVKVGLTYSKNGDGIKIDRIGKWRANYDIVGEGGFELVNRETEGFVMGARVMCLENYRKAGSNVDVIGKFGKIVNCLGASLYGIEFDEPITNGHSSTSTGKRGHCWNILSKNLGLTGKQKQGASGTMKKIISDNFEKTADALLVEKHLGSQITENNIVDKLVVAQNKTAILAEAKRLEAEEEAKKK